MATSGTISFTMTFREAFTRAMRMAKIVASGETPASDEAEDGMAVANLMLKSWQTDCNIWRELSDVIATDTATTVLDPRVMDVPEARITATWGDRPLTRWEWGEYIGLPNKATVGNPAVFVFRRGRDESTLTLWPVPSSTVTISFSAARVIEDIAALDDNLDLPQEWLECFVTNLAVRLSEEYGSDIPGSIYQRAEALLTQMRDLDRPASYFMGAYA